MAPPDKTLPPSPLEVLRVRRRRWQGGTRNPPDRASGRSSPTPGVVLARGPPGAHQDGV